MPDRLTAAQMRKIWAVARKQLGLDDELLHAFVESRTGKPSLRELTRDEAKSVIDELARLAGDAGERTVLVPVGPGGRMMACPLASRAQHWYIKRLAAELGWDSNPSRLRGFCKKYAGVDRPEWLTREQAGKVIEGLKKLRERGAGGGDGGGGRRAPQGP